MRALLVVILGTMAALNACETKHQSVNVPVERLGAQPVVVLPDGFRVECEVANTDPTREQGLMYRESLAPGKGMLFLFVQPGFYPFWMKNTLIPLDMIWIDDAKRIVSVAADVPPCAADPCPTYPPKGNALYVLEIAGGEAARHHLKAGDPIVMQHFENFVAR